jgi:uncharacterized protein YbcI
MEPPKSGGQMLAEISNGLAQLHTQYYGKGPTRAKAYMLNDTVVCLLNEGFTRVEQTLIDEGRGEAVHQIRRTFQAAMEDRFTKVVEQATERTVVAYISQVHVDPDFAVELFVLEPTSEEIVAHHELEVKPELADAEKPA